MINRAKWLIGILAACFLLISAGSALAHNLWLVPDKYNPKAGESVTFQVGFGHKYPASRVDGKVREGMIQEVNVVGPDGKVIKLNQKALGEYTLKVSSPGPYLISAMMNPVFFSRVDGKRKRGNKKDLTGVEQCTRYRMIANAPVFAGNAGKKAASPPSGQELKVLPLADIAGLKKGDALPVKVTLMGTPAVGVMVRAAYAGYKPSPEALAKAEKVDPKLKGREAARQRMMQKMALQYPVSAKTDAQGTAKLKLSSPGWWLVLVSREAPYPDAATCDKNMFKTSYTFEVR